MQITGFILIASVLLLAGVLASKLSARIGVPALLLFIVIGMLAGSEGLGGIPFDDARVAMSVGFIALCLILFDGGLQTPIASLDRELVFRGALLSTVGVAITACLVAAGSVYLLGMSWQRGLLIGAILSSTDAAAVFSIMRARGIDVSRRLRTLIEFESASNDPTAVFLTVTVVALMQGASVSLASLPAQFVYRIFVGAAVGWLAGRGLARLVNWVDLEQEGLYPVFTLASVGIVFGAAELLQTSGFMAAYVTGLALASKAFVHHRSVVRFHNGLAWLMQIAMFLVLGLLSFPSQLALHALPALALSAILVLVARPAAVMLCLAFSGFTVRERLLMAWVGLRGAAPVILATIPLVVGVEGSQAMFATVFFAVVISILIQGPTVGLAARLLKVAEAPRPDAPAPFEWTAPRESGVDHARLVVGEGSAADGHRLVTVGGPGLPLVVMVSREGRLFVPTGGTRLRHGDELYVVGELESIERMRSTLAPG